MKYQQNISLQNWIYNNTLDSSVVTELGSGFFINLSFLHPNVTQKIGIEIYKPYIDNAKYHDCIKIHGNILEYKELLSGYTLDTVLIVDVLEHFDMPTAFNLIQSIKQDFRKILLMLPVGVHILTEDVTGFGGHEYQTHRSTWYEKDILKLDFHVNIIDPNFHYSKPSPACYFGVWSNNKI